MKTNHLWIAAIIVVLAIFALLAAVNKEKEVEPGFYDDLAACMTENGTKMYGAYWCPHCISQKEKFGNSWSKVDYVECSLPNRGGQNVICDNAGITGYPTWEFGDGTRQGGDLPLDLLAEKSGCELSVSSNN